MSTADDMREARADAAGIICALARDDWQMTRAGLYLGDARIMSLALADWWADSVHVIADTAGHLSEIYDDELAAALGWFRLTIIGGGGPADVADARADAYGLVCALARGDWQMACAVLDLGDGRLTCLSLAAMWVSALRALAAEHGDELAAVLDGFREAVTADDDET